MVGDEHLMMHAEDETHDTENPQIFRNQPFSLCTCFNYLFRIPFDGMDYQLIAYYRSITVNCLCVLLLIEIIVKLSDMFSFNH